MGEAHLQVDYIAKLTNQTSLPTYQQSVNPVLISHEYDNGLQIVMVVCGITVHISYSLQLLKLFALLQGCSESSTTRISYVVVRKAVEWSIIIISDYYILSVQCIEW